MKNITVIIMMLLLTGSFSCKDTYTERFFQEDELTITAYLEEHSDEYSMLLELLDVAGFRSAFNAYGTYTFFIYDNTAFTAYLNANGMSSVSDMSMQEAQTLVKYHTLKTEVTSSSLGLGKLPAKNLEDDELVSSFDSTGLQGIIINREAKVITRDIELSNGIVHVLDHTLTPVVKSIVQKMETIGGYSIFIDVAKATGFYDILNTIYDTISPTEIDRLYYTVFAETDEIYNAAGIFTLNDMTAKYDNGVHDPTDPTDTLNKFMANHIIPGRNLFTKDFITGNYQTYDGELINFIVDQTFVINLQGPDSAQTFTSFVVNKTDYQAKNGVFHTVNHMFDIFFPEPVEVVWDFLDQPYAKDLKLLGKRDTPTETNLDNYPNMTGTINGIHGHFPWEGYGFLNKDAMIMDGPAWDFTVHMPIKIVKGRYKLYLNAKGGSGRATIQVLVNGVPVGEPVNLNGDGTWWAIEFTIGEINLTETKENDIRLVTVNNGQGQLDYLKFEPI